MGLSCECPTDSENYAFFYETNDEQKPLDTSRRKRCKSCNELIDKKGIAVEFTRWRYPITDVEIQIYHGEEAEVPLASHYECESCNDLRSNLEALGYCCLLGADLRELTKEYAALHH